MRDEKNLKFPILVQKEREKNLMYISYQMGDKCYGGKNWVGEEDTKLSKETDYEWVETRMRVGK